MARDLGRDVLDLEKRNSMQENSGLIFHTPKFTLSEPYPRPPILVFFCSCSDFPCLCCAFSFLFQGFYKHHRFPEWSWRSFRRNWWRTSGEVWKEIFELLLLGKSSEAFSTKTPPHISPSDFTTRFWVVAGPKLNFRGLAKRTTLALLGVSLAFSRKQGLEGQGSGTESAMLHRESGDSESCDSQGFPNPEGPARHLDASRQKLTPHCLAAIFDSQLPSPEVSLKMPPKLPLPHKRGLSCLFQNYPRGEGNCAAVERQKLSRGSFCLAALRCLSGPCGKGVNGFCEGGGGEISIIGLRAHTRLQ